MYVRKIKEHKINMVKKEFARLGRICDVVRATGYGRTLVHCIVNNHFEVIPTEFFYSRDKPEKNWSNDRQNSTSC
jgi:hypothetical protein